MPNVVSPIQEGNKMPGMQYGEHMGMHPCFTPEMAAGAEAYQMMYPDMYYKMMPHVMMAADEMEMHGVTMPNHQMMMCMCNRVYENMTRMHPEMADNAAASGYYSAQQWGRGRDIIWILLLAELFRRRRRYY